MKRLLVSVALALGVVSPAAGAIELRGLDASGYPLVRFSVVASAPTKAVPRVREGREPVAGAKIVNLGRDTSVVLAIDRSQSMTGRPLADSVEAAQLFARGKSRSDRLAIVTFGSAATPLQPFTTSAREAAGALGSLEVDPERGTALHDGLLEAVRLLRAEEGGGKIVILLTDGRDTSSAAGLEEATAAARRDGVIVHGIGLRGTDFAPAGLRRAAKATGGRFAVAETTAELPGIFASVRSELQRTWRVEYVALANPGDRATVRVGVPGRGTAVAALALPGSAVSSGGTPWYARGPAGDLVLAALVTLLLLLAARRLASYLRMSRLRRRLLWTAAAAPAVQAGPSLSLRERIASAASGLFGVTERALGERRQWGALERTIERAGLPLRAVELVYACVAAGLLAVFLATVLGLPGGLGLLLALLGALVPLQIVRTKAKRRMARFEEQLPDLLMTLASALKSGQSFRAGIQTAAEAGSDPASGELQLALAESRLGRPLDDALSEMADRLGSENFRYVVNAVAIQREVGGSLAGLFDMVADTVRARQQFGRRVKALTAMGRMSAYVMIGLPFVLALGLTLMSSEYMAPLWTTGFGRAMVATALVMIGFGWLVIKRIVAFDG